MWNYLARAEVTAAGLPFIRETNPQEVYVERLNPAPRPPLLICLRRERKTQCGSQISAV